jgi:integrase/recombinase XerD
MQNRLRFVEQRSMNLEEAVRSFLFRCEAEGLSPHTTRFYRRQLQTLVGYLGAGTWLGNVGADAIRGLLAWLSHGKRRYDKPDGRAGLAPESVACHYRAARAFFRYLHREGYLEANPMDSIRAPRTPKRQVLPFNEEQARALLTAPNRKTVAGLRDSVMVLMLLDTGIRVSELLGIRMQDVDWERGMIAVMGKGSRERSVPLGTRARRELQRYLSKRRDLQRHDPLFVTSTGRQVSQRSFQTRLARYGRKAGVEGVRCSPHTFRHTFATWWLRNGGDVFTLQRILGHSSLEMVKRYLSLSTEDLQAAHRRWSPGDALR